MSNAKTTAKSATPAADAVKTFVAFFTREDTKGPKVEIFKDISGKPKAPLYSGKVGTKRVALFLRNGKNGAFLGLVGDKIEGSKNSEDLGTANVRTLGNGTPLLVMDFIGTDGKKTPVFASISKKVSNDELIAIGLNVAKQAEKVAAAAAPKTAAGPKA
jgi:hypothetical protein